MVQTSDATMVPKRAIDVPLNKINIDDLAKTRCYYHDYYNLI